MQSEWFRDDKLDLPHIQSALRQKADPNVFQDNKHINVTPLTKAMHSSDLQKTDVVKSLLESKAYFNLMLLDDEPLFLHPIKGGGTEGMRLIAERSIANLSVLLELFKIWPKKHVGDFFIKKLWQEKGQSTILQVLHLWLPIVVGGLVLEYKDDYSPPLEHENYSLYYTSLLGYFLLTKIWPLQQEKPYFEILNLFLPVLISKLVIDYTLDCSALENYLQSHVDRLSKHIRYSHMMGGTAEPLPTAFAFPKLATAAYGGNMPTLQALVEAKADVTIKDKQSGWTPLDYTLTLHQHQAGKYITRLLSTSYITLLGKKPSKQTNERVTPAASLSKTCS